VTRATLRALPPRDAGLPCRDMLRSLPARGATLLAALPLPLPTFTYAAPRFPTAGTAFPATPCVATYCRTSGAMAEGCLQFLFVQFVPVLFWMVAGRCGDRMPADPPASKTAHYKLTLLYRHRKLPASNPRRIDH